MRIEVIEPNSVQWSINGSRLLSFQAKLLKEKSNESGDIPALEARSELYWSAAVPLLERLQNNQTIRSSHVKLFDYIGYVTLDYSKISYTTS